MTRNHLSPTRTYARIPSILPLPDFLHIQRSSFEKFITEGIREVLEEFTPIQDLTGARFELRFLDYSFGEPPHSEEECREKELTYSRPLFIWVLLEIKETGEQRKQRLFFGDVPWMTGRGTFIVNGAERVVVSQLMRSPGAYFTLERDPATERRLAYGKLIPYRGAWLEFETTTRDILYVKVDRRRKAPITVLLRALGLVPEEEVMKAFADVDTDPKHPYLRKTLEEESREPRRVAEIEAVMKGLREEELRAFWESFWGQDGASPTFSLATARALAWAHLDLYHRLRPGEPLSLENATAHLDNLFFNPRRYDLGKVGVYKLNQRLKLRLSRRTPTPHDLREVLVAIVRTLIRLNNGEGSPDDIDHLGNRRVRSVGELLQNQLRVGFLRMERATRERMTTLEVEKASPAAVVNVRPIQAALREFFGASQLSQFMDQANPLAELTHKRRLSALGPGGLSRERAGFEVRDVHHSHYGRICPIETPEGPNIGLLTSLTTYARTDEYGFIQTPYRRVFKDLPNTSPDLVGRTLRQDITDKSGRPLARAGEVVTQDLWERLRKLPPFQVAVRPFVTTNPGDILYLSASEEEEFTIGQATVPLDEKGQIQAERTEARRGDKVLVVAPAELDLIDVSPLQIVSVSASLIPFLEHDDANRALMGSNMQRQAVPLLKPEAPLVGTGVEAKVARDSGQVVCYLDDLTEEERKAHPPRGVVTAVSAEEVVVRCGWEKCPRKGVHRYRLTKCARTNQNTCFNQHPIVSTGQVVTGPQGEGERGQPLADSSASDQGVLALGCNVLVAFMSWEGYNFEDAVVVSESLVREDKFTSVHIEKYECEARETKLGPEEITRDIPGVGEDALANLDEEGIVRIGAEVNSGDILVGKITPKGEEELTPEMKLLRAIFGEKARDVRDTSLRVPHGERGKVIAVRVLSKETDELEAGVRKAVRVWVAQTRKLTVGDKMAGRHGNKGVISTILPPEDMPYLPDGTPVEMVLNPLGVPSRMNLGQILETHLGWVARNLGFRAICPVFQGARDIDIEDGLARVWFVHRARDAKGRPATDPLDPTAIRWEVVREWLAARGYDMDRLFSDQHLGEARRACLLLWLEDHKEALGDYGVQDPSALSDEELLALARRLNREKRLAPPILGQMTLYDGRTGEPFDRPVTVGYIYMMKLIHLVEDKIHARSVGPYSLITQQPLGGKAQFGGQRFGEMEVWALEAYSAAANLQEMLTVKSDDVTGRQKTSEAIVKGEDITQPGIPESFQVLLKELQALGLSVELLYEPEEKPAPSFLQPALPTKGASESSPEQ